MEEKVLISAVIPLLQYLLRARFIGGRVGHGFKKKTNKKSTKFGDMGLDDSIEWLYCSTH